MANRWKCTYELYFHMSVLLTFGLASPFLGFATGCSYVVQSTAYVLFVGRIRAQVRDQAEKALEVSGSDRQQQQTQQQLAEYDATAGIQAAERDLEHQLRGIFDHVYGPMWLIVVTSVLFWSLFAYDMIGDVYGAEAGTAAVLVTILVTPALILVCVVLVLLLIGMAMMKGMVTKQQREGEVHDVIPSEQSAGPDAPPFGAVVISALRAAISGTTTATLSSLVLVSRGDGTPPVDGQDRSTGLVHSSGWSHVYPQSVNSLFVFRNSTRSSSSREVERASGNLSLSYSAGDKQGDGRSRSSQAARMEMSPTGVTAGVEGRPDLIDDL
jgi:hypothetical protein